MSRSYVEKILKLPSLSAQGDGMRSFATLALELMEDSNSVLLIDEPEAFLHPPQAFLLGRLLGKVASKKQIFIATHSSDFVKGVVENNNANINIIRLEREGRLNVPSLLDTKNLKRVWADPVLRFSPIVDGLFHQQVFLCESDGDCRFFSAVIESLYHNDPRSDKILDSLFVPTHGKAKMPAICNALNVLSVPTAVICDFDIFNSHSPLRELIEAKGGNWAHYELQWKIMKTSIDGLKSQLSKKEIIENIGQCLQSVAGDNLTIKDVEKIKSVLKISTAWSFAKSSGLSFVPPGEAFSACRSMLDKLMNLGIYVLPVGELESFDKSVGAANKSKWLETVLTKNLVDDPDLSDARKFSKGVIESTFD